MPKESSEARETPFYRPTDCVTMARYPRAAIYRRSCCRKEPTTRDYDEKLLGKMKLLESLGRPV